MGPAVKKQPKNGIRATKNGIQWDPLVFYERRNGIHGPSNWIRCKKPAQTWIRAHNNSLIQVEPLVFNEGWGWIHRTENWILSKTPSQSWVRAPKMWIQVDLLVFYEERNWIHSESPNSAT